MDGAAARTTIGALEYDRRPERRRAGDTREQTGSAPQACCSETGRRQRTQAGGVPFQNTGSQTCCWKGTCREDTGEHCCSPSSGSAGHCGGPRGSSGPSGKGCPCTAPPDKGGRLQTGNRKARGRKDSATKNAGQKGSGTPHSRQICNRQILAGPRHDYRSAGDDRPWFHRQGHAALD